MPPKIMCDGCRGMFTVQDLKIHLGFDQSTEAGAGQQLNNRGNRRTTAPAFNLNDPSLFFERCPRRAERVGRAGVMQADELAPQSLPIVLPYHIGRAQLEELKDQLVDAWHAFHTKQAKLATQELLNRNAKAFIAPSASSSMRPREGRNVLLSDDVRRMNAASKKAECNARESASSSARVAPQPQAVAKPPLPAYMRPLQRAPSAGVRQGTPRAPLNDQNISRVAHVDPQSVNQLRGGGGKGNAGYVRVSAGQPVPYYVKL